MIQFKRKLATVGFAALCTLVSYGIGHYKGGEAKRKEITINTAMNREFVRRYDIMEPSPNPRVEERDSELRQAFVFGEIPQNPYPNYPETLEKIAEQGRKVREELEKEYDADYR